VGYYDDEIATALELIAEFGETSTLRRTEPGDPPDTDQPWRTGAPTPADHSVSAVWLDWEVDRIDGELIKAGDQRVFVAASGMTVTPSPTVDRILRASGEEWTIVTVRTLNPNGETILHELQVRK
jgi:hypothetical protein